MQVGSIQLGSTSNIEWELLVEIVSIMQEVAKGDDELAARAKLILDSADTGIPLTCHTPPA
jgi:hypothetical protein